MVLRFSTLLAATAVVVSTEGAPVSLPNLVMALTDDLGWNSPGYHNPTILSPTLDRLAKEGVKMARHYTYR
jgi:arylsulfatase A-like enzyme